MTLAIQDMDQKITEDSKPTIGEIKLGMHEKYRMPLWWNMKHNIRDHNEYAKWYWDFNIKY